MIYFVMNIQFISIYNWHEVPMEIPSDDSITKVVITPYLECDNNPTWYKLYGCKSTVIYDANKVNKIVDYLNKLPLKSVSSKKYDNNTDLTRRITFVDSNGKEIAAISVSENDYISGMNYQFYKSFFSKANIMKSIEDIFKETNYD